MTNTLYHHVFRPWTLDGDRRVVASEEYWREPMRWSREMEFDRQCSKCGGKIRRDTASAKTYRCYRCGPEDTLVPLARPRVLVGVDPFEDWRGWMVGSDGEPMDLCDVCGAWCVDDLDGFCPTPKCGRIKVRMNELTMQDVRLRSFDFIDHTPNLDWMVETERPERVAAMMPPAVTNMHMIADAKQRGDWHGEQYRPNVFLGAVIRNQQDADERIPHLLRCPARRRYVHARVGMERIDFLDGPTDPESQMGEWSSLDGLDWLIISGDIGPDARPCSLAVVRDLLRQARDAGVPAWVERLGSNCFSGELRDQLAADGVGGYRPEHNYNQLFFNDPNGADPTEWPDDLRVREEPKSDD